MVMACIMLFNLTGCGKKVQAGNLMGKIETVPVNGKTADSIFVEAQADFAVKLFQNSLKENENSLISPLSVMLALSMTANGANTETREEMEELLGGGIPLENLNEYLYSYVKNLPNEDEYSLKLANSIWFRDSESLTVKEKFLQKNADYYGAAAYKAAFDGQTVKDINSWVKENTDGMIDKVVNEIDGDTVMYLINALAFDAQWQEPYKRGGISDGLFRTAAGSEKTVEMMSSEESKYLSDGKAVGFIKDYKDGRYSFAALLPDEKVTVEDYIASLTGESLLQAIRSAENMPVCARMPKFSYEYEIKMNEALKALGMSAAFDSARADFSEMGKSAYGNIYIGSVLHKTFVSIDEFGTKAGAVTTVEMKAESAAEVSEKIVVLDRPFAYLIIDNATGLPIFMGTVMDIQK